MTDSPKSQIHKIAVVGNIAGGKTRLSRSLAARYNLPITHVDSIQFIPGMQIRPFKETRDVLLQVAGGEQWLIDGYGPLEIIEKRFQAADRVVFIDFPLWRHQWWCFKRQVKNLWSRRPELPEGCSELSFEHSRKLFRSMKSAHRQMRPELLRIFARDNLKEKVVHIRTLKDWNRVFKTGL